MNHRWETYCIDKLPTIDYEDTRSSKLSLKAAQFAAEYSQMAYLTMLEREYELGNYRKANKKMRKAKGLPKLFALSSRKREKMIVII